MVNVTHITLHVNMKKRQHHIQEGMKNTRHILVDDMPKVARATKALFKCMRMMETRRARRWTLTAKEDRSEWMATTNMEWLQLALRASKHNFTQCFN